MKDKNIAGILALFFGWLGVHRFYLGQIGLGIVYAVFFWVSWIFAIIDAIAFLSMDTDEFNIKYNKEYYRATRRRQRQNQEIERRRKARSARDVHRERVRQQKGNETTPQRPKHNPYKQSGIKKFRDFDYKGAIQDFEKALEITPGDVAVHFNLACSYSLTEKPEKAFFHLDKAVANGFNDFDRIKNHDALAYLRVQPQFEQFQENGYRLVPQLESPKENLLDSPPTEEEKPAEEKEGDLLEQLKNLAELKEKGLLTSEEFERQKQKILRRGRNKD